MPAPISPKACACSSTSTLKPLMARPSAQARPPMPPPAIATGFVLRGALIAARSVLERKADVVLCQRLLCCRRAKEVSKLRCLDPAPKGVGVGKTVQERGHPPGETLGEPDAAQASLGVTVESRGVAAAVVRDQSAREITHVGDREIEPFRPGR